MVMMMTELRPKHVENYIVKINEGLALSFSCRDGLLINVIHVLRVKGLMTPVHLMRSYSIK
jgi:hypothetical protein